jgi:hypothetical protein
MFLKHSLSNQILVLIITQYNNATNKLGDHPIITQICRWMVTIITRSWYQ